MYDSKQDTTMEMDVENVLRMLSAYFIVAATINPPVALLIWINYEIRNAIYSFFLNNQRLNLNALYLDDHNEPRQRIKAVEKS